MNKTEKISFSFIIFTYNSGAIIKKTLSHLKKAIKYYTVEHEIILVDNNSNDNTIEIVKEFCLKSEIEITILNNPKQGLAFSRTVGVKIANKEFICFIDDDNFLFENWIKVLTKTINDHNPDVIGCRTIGISDTELPDWWGKYKQYYACGVRFPESGFLQNPLHKMWGAGLTARKKYVQPALLKQDLLCTGRIGKKQMTGEDAELNYRMRLLGASFYNCNDLVLSHFMRPQRLNKEHLNKTFKGNGLAAINLDIYKYLLTGKKRYKLFNMAVLVLLGAPYLSYRHNVNYFNYILPRFNSLKDRVKTQKEFKELFSQIN
jgi:glycosyltransferase involved in cell wall biosynthesis